MDEANEVVGDVIARLIEGDMLSGEQWRPAAALDMLVQGLTSVADSDRVEESAYAQDLLGEILLNMTYMQIYTPEDEEAENERDILRWRTILDRIDREDEDNEEEHNGE